MSRYRVALVALTLAAVALAVGWSRPAPGAAQQAQVELPGAAEMAPAPLAAGSSAAAASATGATAGRPGDNAAGGSEFGADGSARGVARAVREAVLSTRMQVRIVDIVVPEGEAFEKDAVLIKFDCERQLAEARAAAAAADAQKKMVETNEELDKFESIGKNDLSISRSQLEKAHAESDALKALLKDCTLRAPFAGRVVERIARKFENVAATQPLMRVVDTREVEIDLIVPSAWLQWLDAGERFKFRIDETGQSAAGTVTRLTPTVDPVSKSTRVIARLQPGASARKILPGMSGTALFDHFRTVKATAGADTAAAGTKVRAKKSAKKRAEESTKGSTKDSTKETTKESADEQTADTEARPKRGGKHAHRRSAHPEAAVLAPA